MMRSARRLIFVHGPWQLLVAASALKQAAHRSGNNFHDDLIIVSLHDGPLPLSIRSVLGRIAPTIWPWRQVVDLEHMVNSNEHDSLEPIRTLRTKLGSGEPEELWLTSLWGWPEKVAMEAYPNAQIVLYEDGLHSYIPAEDYHLSLARCLREPRLAYRALRMRINERRAPGNLSIAPILPRHLARVVASYLWISLMLPPAQYQTRLPWIQLDTRFLKDTINQVSPVVDDIDFEGGDGHQVIVLGQCFSNYGDVARDVELAWYIDMVRWLQERDYEVIWKEHPRTRQPFLSELVHAVPGVRAVPDLGPWPIELFVERLRLAACASISSTSLYSIPLLFGLPSFSPASRYTSLFRFPNDLLAQLVAKSIPAMGNDEPGSDQSRHREGGIPAGTGGPRTRAIR
jgi:hypothetical protein